MGVEDLLSRDDLPEDVREAIAEESGKRQRAEREKEAMSQISGLFLTSATLRESFSELAKILSAQFGYATVAVELYDESAGEMEFAGVVGMPTRGSEPLRVPVDQTLSGTVATTGEAVVETHASRRREYRFEALRSLGIETFLCVPIQSKGRVLGTLALGDPRTRDDAGSLCETLQSVANYVAQEIERKRAEEGLQKAHDELERRVAERSAELEKANEALRFTQFAIDHASVPAFWMAEDARLIYVNEAACRSLGYSREELLSMRMADFDPLFPPDAWPEHWEAVRQSRSLTLESRHRRKDGRVFPVEVQANYVKFGGKEYNCAFARDISAMKEAEAALRESEGKFRNIVESSPLGMHLYVLEPDGRLVFTGANPAADTILGVDCAQFVGQTIGEAFPPLAGTEVPERYRRACATGEPWHTEQIAYEHGQIKGAFEVNAFQIEPGRMAAMFLDITERKRAEEALRESEETFRQFFDNEPEYCYMVSADGRITEANKAALDRLGYSRDELTGQPLSKIYAPDCHPKIQRLSAAWQETGRLENEEVAIVTKTGERRTVLLSASVVRDHEGGIRHSVSVQRDITELKRAEEERRNLEAQVQHAQKLESLGILAGGVAHDFNNLLVGMLGHSSLALGKLPPESPARRNLEGVVQAAERAADLSRQMLAYSGHGHFVVQKIDLSALVRENVHLLGAGIPKSVQLRTDLSETPVQIEADLGQIQQVIMNLVINGAEAMGEGPGTVTIATGREELSEDVKRYSRYTATDLQPGSYAFLQVRDNGSGMDGEALSKLFDPFFTTKFVGRGLGLSAVLGIIRGHKGGIDVQSEPGKGTTFRLVFPAVEGAPPAERTTVGRGRVGGTVLVIDDEEIVRDLVGEMLAPEGLTVLTAGSGAAGLALYEEKRAEVVLVLLDFSMPEMGGEETFKELRKINPDVPVVLSSGFGEEEATRRFEGLGLSGFIQKPYTPDALLAEIRRFLEPGSPGDLRDRPIRRS